MKTTAIREQEIRDPKLARMNDLLTRGRYDS